MISIRRIKPSDNDHVRALIDSIMQEEFATTNQAYARHDLEDPAAYYNGSKDIFLVAEKDGRIIGTVAIKEDSPTSALLRRIFVRKECRGQGCGDMLLRKAIEFCFEHHYQNVTFRGTDQMQQALKLCLKEGFKEDDIVATDAFKMFILNKQLETRST
ncbi:MAG: GNAT family N-acetyltransferase [Kiritimatiellia bacterium]|nr:GNAT family N-acetyltransferase [Lentisphaerota bacterium]